VLYRTIAAEFVSTANCESDWHSRHRRQYCSEGKGC